MEWILLFAASALGVYIIKERRNERLEDEVCCDLSSNLDGLEEEDELDWYDWAEYSTCEICDELILEEEIIMGLADEDGEIMRFCEYCLNPDLKD